jgi:two-component system response regulator HydG
MEAQILVVDDEEANRQALDRILSREGYSIRHAGSGREALERIRKHPPAVMLTDLKMPGMSGLELMKAARTVQPELEVIVMTAFGTVETAVSAMKEGAWDFVTKPLSRAEIVRAVRKALERNALVVENRQLKTRLEAVSRSDLIGSSAPMKELLDEAAQVADSMASVLITGESGTGKGMLARWLHARSSRKKKALVTINCAALPESLLESELFGHEAGAFTGAQGKKEGRFDLARGGTLFLDEISEMSPQLQVKLLRVLQDGEYERVGGTQTLQADVRIFAATNQDPEAAIASGALRADLFYRLNVIRMVLPPLRERPLDIPLLAHHFTELYAARNGRAIHGLSPEALDALSQWRWPGNVRELENAIERAVVLSRTERIELGDLPRPIRAHIAEPHTLSFAVGTPIKDIERQMIEATLRQTRGDKALAARLLGITARTIYRREAEWRGEELTEA